MNALLGERLRVEPYARQYRGATLQLCAESQWTHQHLDWFSLEQWLDQERGVVFLAWEGADLAGCIGLAGPLAGSAWIRLLCIRDGRAPSRAISRLWQSAEDYCLRMGVRRLACLMVTNWLSSYLRGCGFAYHDDIISMSHIGCRMPKPRAVPAETRRAEPYDAPAIAAVDRQAFAPLWRLSEAEIWQALRICTRATVALREGRVAGYHFGARHDDIGHLARLAVSPDCQGQGIGALLLRDFLGAFQRLPISTISVNTQLSNKPSQRLYERFGFFRNGTEIEMWRRDID